MTSDLYTHNYIDYCGNNNKKQMYLVSVSTPFMWSGSLHWVLIQDFCLARKLELSQMWCFHFHRLGRVKVDGRGDRGLQCYPGCQFKYCPTVSLSESSCKAPKFAISTLPLSEILGLFSLH